MFNGLNGLRRYCMPNHEDGHSASAFDTAGATPGPSAATSSNELLHLNASRRYLLLSPCRDEAQYLRRTLDSVAAQSVPPALWVVVDDGSTDGTLAILEEYARRLPYLRIVRRADRGGRQVGPGVIEAFYAGLD